LNRELDMCIEDFKLCYRKVSGPCWSTFSAENQIRYFGGLEPFVADLNLCSCNKCPVFKELWLKLGLRAHVDTRGDLLIGYTTLSRCQEFQTPFRWLPLVCSNAHYNGLAENEAHLCLPLSSYPKIYSESMNVSWEEFSSCLQGRMSGFKKYYSFRTTGKLIYVYNKTCWAFGFPCYKRSTCINKYEKESLKPVIDSIVQEAESMDRGEVLRLIRELNNIDPLTRKGIALTGLPEYQEEAEAKPFIDDMSERLEALEKYEGCVKKEEDLLRSLQETYGSVNFPEKNLEIHRELADKLKSIDGRSVGVLSDGTNFYDEDFKLKHAGVPQQKKLSRRTTVKFPGKHNCENLEKMKVAYKNYLKLAVKAKKKESGNTKHDWSQFKATFVDTPVKKNLKQLPNSSNKTCETALENFDKKVVFPLKKFYTFMKRVLYREVDGHKYRGYLTVNDDLTVSQTRTLRAPDFFSDNIAREAFWVTFNRKYGTQQGLQHLLSEFSETNMEVDVKDVNKKLIRFMGSVQKMLKSRKKRWQLSEYPDEVLMKLGTMLLTYDPAIIAYRKKIGMRSGMLRSLVSARHRIEAGS